MAVDPALRSRTWSYLIRILGGRDYSRKQLEDKLKLRGIAPGDSAALIEELITEGWFKEDAYKKSRSRQILRRGYGPAMLKSKLARDRISISQDELDTAYREIDSSALEQGKTVIAKYLRRNARKLATLKRFEIRARLATELTRKGYRASDFPLDTFL